jgi:hypothetical protein
MRYHVTCKVSAVVTLNRMYEIEAESEEQAKELITSGESFDLDDDEFFPVGDDEIDEIHSSEILPFEMEAGRVG